MPKYGETPWLDYRCKVRLLGYPPHFLIANKLMPFDSRQCSHLSTASILHAFTLMIAQHSDMYRKIGRIRVLYNFNFVGIDMCNFQKWLSRLCIAARWLTLTVVSEFGSFCCRRHTRFIHRQVVVLSMVSKAPFTHSRMRSRIVPDGWSGTIRDYSLSAL